MKNKVAFLIQGRPANLGFPVKRILPFAKKRMVGPFIFLDQMGPALLSSSHEPIDIRPHPHIGLATLTYLFQGELMHRDSLGIEQLISPRQVNWMTAGKGISHSEREPESYRNRDRWIHGLQFWVALPVEKEEKEPSFHHYLPKDIPEIKNKGLHIRVVAGEAFGKTSSLLVYSPMTFLVCQSHEKGTFHVPGMSGHEYALYVVSGKLDVNQTTVQQHEMIVFEQNSEIEAHFDENSLFVLIGGEVFLEPRYIFWNFVSSNKEKIEKAKVAWSNGTFPQVPGDHDNAPLPEI
jgi:redox-sensitive bicupin YhaK (pirin superfamily)